MGRRKQRGSRASAAAKERPPQSSAAPAERPRLPPARPPRRNLPLLFFSIVLFLAWLVVLIILAAHS